MVKSHYAKNQKKKRRFKYRLKSIPHFKRKAFLNRSLRNSRTSESDD